MLAATGLFHKKRYSIFTYPFNAVIIQWFPDHAILEAKVGGKVKFSFNRENFERILEKL
jgi:hypothetical protein